MRMPWLIACVLALVPTGCRHMSGATGASFTAVNVNAGPGEVGLQLNNAGAKVCFSSTDCLYDNAGTLTGSGSVVFAAGAGTNPVQLQPDTNICWNPPTCSVTLTADTGSMSTPMAFQSSQYRGSGASPATVVGVASDGASAVGVISGAYNTLSTSGAVLHSFQNNIGGTPSTKATVDFNGVYAGGGITCTGATHCGVQALTAGSATVTVVSGCHAICTDTTAAAAVKCSVSSTTLTIAGTGTDSINYFCF